MLFLVVQYSMFKLSVNKKFSQKAPKLRNFVRKSLLSNMITPFTIDPIEKKQSRTIRRLKLQEIKKANPTVNPDLKSTSAESHALKSHRHEMQYSEAAKPSFNRTRVDKA